MPFDGTGLGTPTVPNTGLFPLWSKHYWWLRFESPVFTLKHTETTRVFLPSPPGLGSDAAVVRLLQDARGLIEDPGNGQKADIGRSADGTALLARYGRPPDVSMTLVAHFRRMRC